MLVPDEVEKLFDNVHAMTKAGKSIVFISHKLGEVVAISDRVTVLRNGRVTGHVEGKGKADTRELARLMVGRDIELNAQRATHPIGHEVLQIRNLSLTLNEVEVLSDISFNIHAGEMVGIAGVAGNGQRELADTIAGLIPPTSGSITIAGAMTTDRGPIQA
ncbi:MAG: hypothetical protein RLZZ43_966, partial [Actinomycetota bacterium]